MWFFVLSWGYYFRWENKSLTVFFSLFFFFFFFSCPFLRNPFRVTTLSLTVTHINRLIHFICNLWFLYFSVFFLPAIQMFALFVTFISLHKSHSRHYEHIMKYTLRVAYVIDSLSFLIRHMKDYSKQLFFTWGQFEYNFFMLY